MPKLKVHNRLSELLARKERREGRSISRRKMAEETGISLSSIQSWASNEVTRFDADKILILCKYLDATPGDLFVIEADPDTAEEENKTPLAAAV